MNGTKAVPHLDDAALVRVLDGEAVADQDAGHLSGCADCQARLAGIRGQAMALSSLLERAQAAEPVPPSDLWERVTSGAGVRALPSAGRPRARPRPWWSRGLPRAAMIAGLLAAGALSAEPVRRWMGERLTALAAALVGDQATEGTDPVPDALLGVVVRFVPEGDRLVIRLDERQAGGTLEIVFEERSDATAEVLGDGPAATVLVLPGGFRARNRQGDRGSYRFRLPVTLDSVEVVVGGETRARLGGGSGAQVVLELGG